MRDLLVFLILFLLGLAVWTTGLFPAFPVQAVPPVTGEIEEQADTVESAVVRMFFASEEQAPAPEPTRAGEEVKRTKAPIRRIAEMGNASDSTARDQKNDQDRKEDRDQKDDRALKEPLIQRIQIPSLKVNAKVVDVPFNGVTWDISSLGQDIARLGELPGEDAGENIVLAGHFSIGWTELGPFRYISRLSIGAPILIYTDRMVYTYQVREHAVVGDQDERVIGYTSDQQLTLLTCETWDEETRKFLRRRVVFADLVRSEPLGNPTIQ